MLETFPETAHGDVLDDPAVGGARRQAIRIRSIPLLSRQSLRVAAGDLPTVERALGFPLPTRIGNTTETGNMRALCLGPDEWYLVAKQPHSDPFAAVLPEPIAHSLVNVSHRDLAFEVDGNAAIEVLSGGCPLDLERMGIGRCTRTLFAAAEIILFRPGEQTFELTAQRSYAPYVEALLVRLARETVAAGSER